MTTAPVCVMCGGSLEGRRRHALTCSGRCRAERSRLRRILDGRGADGRLSVADGRGGPRKRTGGTGG